jgi:hypothetical protein
MQSVTQHPAVRSGRTEAEAPLEAATAVAKGPARAPAKQPYMRALRQELGELIEQLELSPLQQQCLKARWVDTVLWMEKRAMSARNRYYLLRLLIIGGGVLIPALISLEFADPTAAAALKWTTFTISLMVAMSAALEGFFRYGERWRHYRRTVELLKAEGWQYLQQGGGYADFASHTASFPLFTGRVEEIIGSNVETFVTELARERKETEAPAVNG